jgi:hypothetical protein
MVSVDLFVTSCPKFLSKILYQPHRQRALTIDKVAEPVPAFAYTQAMQQPSQFTKTK